MKNKKRKYPELTALKGRIREKKTCYRELASELSISTNTLSDKINGFYSFNVVEMEGISESLDIEPREVIRYFFPNLLNHSKVC